MATGGIRQPSGADEEDERRSRESDTGGTAEDGARTAGRAGGSRYCYLG